MNRKLIRAVINEQILLFKVTLLCIKANGSDGRSK